MRLISLTNASLSPLDIPLHQTVGAAFRGVRHLPGRCRSRRGGCRPFDAAKDWALSPGPAAVRRQVRPCRSARARSRCRRKAVRGRPRTSRTASAIARRVWLVAVRCIGVPKPACRRRRPWFEGAQCWRGPTSGGNGASKSFGTASDATSRPRMRVRSLSMTALKTCHRTTGARAMRLSLPACKRAQFEAQLPPWSNPAYPPAPTG